MSDLYLFDIGWLFFAAWTVMVGVISIKAFAPELFPSKADLLPRPSSQDSTTARSK